MVFIFWLFVSLVLYAYFGYPILLCLMAKLNKNEIDKREIYPFVSMIIAAYNEDKNIEDKIKNTINLEYPKEKLEIIVASDGSKDNTEEIVKKFEDKRVRLFRAEQRVGKTEIQNRVVKEIKGEILVFSDATTIYDPQLVKKIVRNFADSKVGAVGGELVYINKNKSSIGEGGGFYWRYEKFLKKRESQISSLIGVSGCCYAIRKDLYEPMRADLISDFVIAQVVYKKGKRVVYEPEAVSYEETNDIIKDEFKMRVRVAVRTLYGLWHMRSLLNPFKYGFFAIQLITHKILRYLVPLLLILVFLVNTTLLTQTKIWFYKFSLYLQMVFYLSAILGWVFIRMKTFLYVPFYFCLTNLALLVGLFQFLIGRKKVLWNPSRK